MKKKYNYRIEFEGKLQDTLNVMIESVSEKGAKQKFSREWRGYKLLHIYKSNSR